MGFFSDFKAFAVKGNVVDMAVGMVVGTAFTGIVNSLVKDIIMPAVGAATGGVDFSEMKVILKEATAEAEAVSINYGNFINTIINFIIIAFSIFCVVRMLNRAKAKMEAKKLAEEAAAKAAAEAEAAKAAEEAAKQPTQEQLLAEIRDLLRAKNG